MAMVVVVALAGPAAADEQPFVIGSIPSWIVLGGVTTGGTLALADRGAYVGGELSLALLRDGTFTGLYGDAYYDWGASGTYVTSGFEFGYKLIGLDGGVALRFANDTTDVGFAARATIGLGAVGVYTRYMHFFDVMPETSDNVLQVGLVLKLPIWTEGGL